MVFTYVGLSNSGSYENHQIVVWLDEFNLHVYLYYFEGMLTQPSYFKDSIALGKLPVGTYTVIADLRVNYDFGVLEDWNDYEKEDSDTLTFRVSETMDVISNNKEDIHLSIYPNPSSSETIVEFSLSETSKVDLEIFDINERLIYSRDKSKFSTGKHSIQINSTPWSKGMYFIKLKTNGTSKTIKFIKQ